MKILSIVGARPQFIKCAPLSRALRADHKEILVHTGQHYDPSMSDIFFDELGIPTPAYNLGIGSGNHGRQTGEMLTCIEEILLKESPDLVIVYGDTNSTLAGALAAAKLHIPVAHVEAGLRSFDMRMPEEVNRRLTDHISAYLFCPTVTAVENLKREGITSGVFQVGDIMVDALNVFREIADRQSTILLMHDLNEGRYYVLTMHRPQNVDDPARLKRIVQAFTGVDYPVVFPVHPRTRKTLEAHPEILTGIPEGVRLIQPLGYLDMLRLTANSRKVLTDSGGVQKEAYLFGVPCITLRDTTEWVETLENGWNVLVDEDTQRIREELPVPPPPSAQRNVFGDGDTAGRIVEILGQNNHEDEQVR